MMSDITQDAFVSMLEVSLEKDLTPEQKDFCLGFTEPTICFASPGTGKTASATIGLIFTELFSQVPGDNIYALSFTNLATAELAQRHSSAVKRLGASQTIHFQTLHALCSKILKENYRLLGMYDLNTTKSIPIDECARIINIIANTHNLKIAENKMRSIVQAIRSLNSSLIFDEFRVKASMVFKSTGLTYETFTLLRKGLFQWNLQTCQVPVDDILLYTLLLLSTHEEVSREWKSKCKVMLVDEAQDLSLLQLKVISLLTECPVLIGDMKQQIYGFNGACQEIVEQFFRLYPNARKCHLTQSFRCKNEIVEYATPIILHNKIGGDEFKGTGTGGSVTVCPNLSLDDIAQRLYVDYNANNKSFSRDTMFLFRNNVSAIPLAETLYHSGVPFRVKGYKAATEIPVIDKMVELLNFCKNPEVPSNSHALRYVIPELRVYSNSYENPFYKICAKRKCSAFEINYEFRDGDSALTMALLHEISLEMAKGTYMGQLMNMLWPTYYKMWVKPREWMLEFDSSYYTSMVAPIVRNKTYELFIYDEQEKVRLIEENNRYNRGVRCYTMHGAKGLEADDVYILDADTNILPSASKLKKMSDNQCDMDIAREIRNERALLYVACTRAKENLTITFNKELSPMIQGINTFECYDKVYDYYKSDADDIRAFEQFTEGLVS